MNYILSIDQGTTGSTALLINADTYELIDKKNTEFPQIMPKPGIVEHNLEDIFNSVQTSCEQVLTSNNIQANQIMAIGITVGKIIISLLSGGSISKTPRPILPASCDLYPSFEKI